MQVLYTNSSIWTMPVSTDSCEAVCVTTNGMIKKDGTAVMGRGIAKEANEKYDLAGTLAAMLRSNGNHVASLKSVTENGAKFMLFSFPTKNDWRDNSDIMLIEQSAREIVRMCNAYNIKRCYMTPPGCGNGHLNWESQVYPVLSKILDDRFTVVFRM